MKGSLIHYVAECRDCSFYTGDYIRGPRLAYRHARKMGHVVSYEKGFAGHYDYRQKSTVNKKGEKDANFK